MRLVVSQAARLDLKNISAYTEREWGADRKRRYMAAIREKFKLFLRNPGIGISREDIKPGCRSFPAGSHIIFYRRVEDEIHITRVLHQHMDMKRHG